MQKKKNTSPIKRFWNLLQLYKIEMRHIYAYALFNGAVNLTLPLGIQAIINFLQTGEISSTWVILVVFVLMGIAVTGIVQVFQLRIVENIQQDLFARSAFEFSYRLPKVTFFQLDKIHAPELANRFFDTLTIQKGLPKILIDFSLAVFQIVFGLLLLTLYSPYFVMLGGILGLIVWFIFNFSGPKGLSSSIKESKYKYKLAHWLEELARINRTLKLSKNQKFHLDKTDAIVKKYISFREQHFKVLIGQFLSFIGFKLILAASLLLVGGWLVFEEHMNIGQFVAAEIIVLLIINSVEKVIRIVDTIYDVLVALDKIGGISDLQLDKNTGHAEIPQGIEGLELNAHNISFGFPDERQLIFDKLCFRVNSNEKIFLDGPAGSGKTLLLQILSGIYPLEEGELYYNNIPLVNYDKCHLNNAMGVSFPINQIFEGTIRENITLGRDVCEQRIVEVIQLLGLEDFLSKQKKGIDCDTDSGGRRLPGSVIQKLLIARILLNKPKILLLEDPLIHLEEEEKKRLIDYLTSDDYKCTVIVVSKYAYWREKADKVFYLENSKMKEINA